MFFEVGSTKIALHDSVASQVQHAQNAVTYVNQQFTSIGMKGERVDHITLSSQSQVSGYIRKENFPQFFFSTFDGDKLGKIRRYYWKESLKISEIAKFESDLLKTNDEIATQKREILFRIQHPKRYQSFAQLHSRNISCREEKLLICSVHVFC